MKPGFSAGCWLFNHRRGRRVALSNLRVAFGDEISSERRAQIVHESYQHFARTMLDFFWSPRLTSKNFSRYVEFEDRERWDEEDTRPGKPVVVGCYHYSNFEWLSIVSAFAGLEGVVIAQQFKNPLLDPILSKLRQRSGHRVAPRKGAIMHVYRTLRRGERFALLLLGIALLACWVPARRASRVEPMLALRAE